MPAIHPARLKQQAALLADAFDQPESFVRALLHVLDFYADRAHRPGLSGEPSPLMRAFRVRAPVLRQILLELAPRLQADPEAALELCDALWKQPNLECRQLAAGVLGKLPPAAGDPVIERIRLWCEPGIEGQLVDLLLDEGLSRLRQESPQQLIDLYAGWLGSENIHWNRLGLRGLGAFSGEPKFHNLPVFFRLIQPYCRKAPPRLRTDLLDLLRSLIRRSPRETAFFLRQNLSAPDNPDTAWLIRQILPDLPADVQEAMRAGLREGR
jgi:hypothetical protein